MNWFMSMPSSCQSFTSGTEHCEMHGRSSPGSNVLPGVSWENCLHPASGASNGRCINVDWESTSPQKGHWRFQWLSLILGNSEKALTCEAQKLSAEKKRGSVPGCGDQFRIWYLSIKSMILPGKRRCHRHSCWAASKADVIEQTRIDYHSPGSIRSLAAQCRESDKLPSHLSMSTEHWSGHVPGPVPLLIFSVSTPGPHLSLYGFCLY